MADGTKIEWTDATWNVVRGCQLVSPGCTNCYAMRMAHRQNLPGKAYEGLTKLGGRGPVWTGRARFVPELLEAPLHWRKPRRIFVNAMSDLFHDDVAFEQIAAVFGVMAATPQHTYQVLTKRPARMVEFFKYVEEMAQRCAAAFPDDPPTWRSGHVLKAAAARSGAQFPQSAHDLEQAGWPLPNVWLGVSVENQVCANERVPLLLQVPAAVRFLSCEPLLGPLNLSRWVFDRAAAMCRVMHGPAALNSEQADAAVDPMGIHWVIVGGESGAGARPMHPTWVRKLRDQCAGAGVSFFFKQWGGWAPLCNVYDPEKDRLDLGDDRIVALEVSGVIPDWQPDESAWFMQPASKKDSGRELDGRTWSEFPAPKERPTSTTS